MNAISLCPCTHNKRVIISHSSNDINTLLAQGGEIGNVTWKMRCAAGGGESSGEGEDDDFLVGPFCGFGLLVGWTGE